jgi:hypothetical protein
MVRLFPPQYVRIRAVGDRREDVVRVLTETTDHSRYTIERVLAREFEVTFGPQSFWVSHAFARLLRRAGASVSVEAK